MDLELITWKTGPAPTDPAKWPCMVCRTELATHRRTLHRGHRGTDIKMIVCLECGRLSDELLWESLHDRPVTPLDTIIRRVCD